MITDRDLRIVEFLSRHKVANTEILSARFFPSLRMAQKRLALLAKWGEIQRSREHITRQYVYFLGNKPKQLRHMLLRTEFYHKFPEKFEIFEPEYTVGSLRADAIFKFHYTIAFLEVQVSAEKPDLAKYRRFYLSGEYVKYFSSMPKIYVVTDHVFFLPKELDVIKIPTRMLFDRTESP